MKEKIKELNKLSDSIQLEVVSTKEDLFFKGFMGYIDKNYVFNIKVKDTTVGSIALNFRDECTDGIFIENIYVATRYNGNNYAKQVVYKLKEVFGYVYGEADNYPTTYWTHIGAELLNENNLFII